MSVLYQIRKISMEQWFVMIVFVLSLLLSFLGGYVVFRYWQVDVCKSEVLLEDFGT